MHKRYGPVPHQFRYPLFTFVFDLEELPELDRSLCGFGYNRPALISLHDRDYLRGEGSIREKLMRFLSAEACGDDVVRVELMTMPRMFGHVFNPVSFYYCYRGDGSIHCIVAEVSNTFKERHLYFLKQSDGAGNTFPLRFQHEKQFHVSPFNNRKGHYEFSFSEPGPKMRITIDLVRDGEKVLTASLWGDALPLNAKTLRKYLLLHPFRIVATIPRITWQAAQLYYRRKLQFFHKPNPSHPMTIRVASPSLTERLCIQAVRRLLSGLKEGRLLVVLPDGTEWTCGSETGHPCTIRVWNYRFFRRVMLAGDIGFGESYTAGEWTTDDLPGLLTLLLNNLKALDAAGPPGMGIALFATRILHAFRRNTRVGSRRNIRAHYDLGNDFYRRWLDEETMMYSCAVFNRPGQRLADAQREKIHRIVRMADIKADDHVLEIGCGWGGFAVEAVRETGCRVTGITISKAQFEVAQQRVIEAGLQDRITLLLQDYRELEGRFDRIVSIEMLEAVGHEYFGLFFRKCAALLKPGGRMVLQVITIPDDRYEGYRRNPDWIQKHIFPGGILPSRAVLSAAMEGEGGMRVESAEDIGLHYAETLRHWRQRFREQSAELGEMGFDDEFQRKWEYYFSYCEAGFSTGYISDWQMVVVAS